MPAWQQQPQCLYGLVGTACWLRLRGLRTLLSLEVEFETTILHLQNLHWFITNRGEVNVCLKLAFSLRKSRTPIHFIAIVTGIELATQVFFETSVWFLKKCFASICLFWFLHRACVRACFLLKMPTQSSRSFLSSIKTRLSKKLLKSQSLICYYYVKCSWICA